jgi:hypothetical protein
VVEVIGLGRFDGRVVADVVQVLVERLGGVDRHAIDPIDPRVGIPSQSEALQDAVAPLPEPAPAVLI